MLTLIYRLIVLFMVILISWNFWEEDEVKRKIVASLVLIPLILRFLMIK